METDSDQPAHESAAIDRALTSWRQGDCVVERRWFAFSRLGQEGVELAEEEVEGLVVVTQTCDVVRASADRPYVEMSPLVLVDDDKHYEVERGRYPRYVAIPSLASSRLVADLDRTMTVHKSVVATWKRQPGWSTDAEIRAIASALARKRARFAFPDDFVDRARKLESRLVDKHDKDSDEGCALRVIREIRVQASPSWDADQVTLMFWFIRNEDDRVFDDGPRAAQWLERWLKLFQDGGRYVETYGQITTLHDMTAADYVASDALDLSHLSTR